MFARVQNTWIGSPREPVFLSLEDGDTEVAADLLLGGHVPASFPRQQRDQPLGHLLLRHRKQVNSLKTPMPEPE